MAFDSLAGVLAGAAVVVVAVLFFLLLFEPGLPYRFTRPQSANDSREFVDFLSAIVNARLFSAGEGDGPNPRSPVYAGRPPPSPPPHPPTPPPPSPSPPH